MCKISDNSYIKDTNNNINIINDNSTMDNITRKNNNINQYHT